MLFWQWRSCAWWERVQNSIHCISSLSSDAVNYTKLYTVIQQSEYNLINLICHTSQNKRIFFIHRPVMPRQSPYAIFAFIDSRRLSASLSVSSRLAKWRRMRLLTGSWKKLEPGTAPTPTFWARSTQNSRSLA